MFEHVKLWKLIGGAAGLAGQHESRRSAFVKLFVANNIGDPGSSFRRLRSHGRCVCKVIGILVTLVVCQKEIRFPIEQRVSFHRGPAQGRAIPSCIFVHGTSIEPNPARDFD